ncbi:MAG: HAD-IC family P-type ATPase [Phototrophicales bacterium]|nr:HAD-IC family P-type ATPase [Phototrophicales bacterium]
MMDKKESPLRGLSANDVRQRMAHGESNYFKARVGRTYIQILRDNLFNVFNMLLFVLLLIVLISQDYFTVLFAGFSVVTNSLIGTIQEILAKRQLNKLASLAPQQADVWRDGVRQTILNQDVVKDDLIFIVPGDRVVVDGFIVEADSLEIDESQLTGESDAVYKAPNDPVTSGSFCIAGSGIMQATRVGSHSTANKLTAVAKTYKVTLTPTQRYIAVIVRFTLLVLFVLGPMVFMSGIMTNIPFLNTVRNMVVFTTSLVPQGLILTAILALSIGAIKISRRRTLIQRINAVESIANVTVLCFDKTGTLTQNKLFVNEIIPISSQFLDDITNDLRIYVGNLSHQNTTATAIAQHLDIHSEDTFPPKEQEIPFTSGRKWGAMIFREAIFVLGAPERVLTAENPANAKVAELSAAGLRVLAFARAELPPLPDHPLDTETIQPVALIVIHDEIRPNIQETLASFISQNVRPKVISGDNVQTVKAVAGLAGMNISLAYTGVELNAMDDLAFAIAVKESDVFARIEPDTKRRIIQSLREQGEYVAMVGDGMNDVPALKAADVAIVMNDGAQISKDVADIVLLDNEMSTLPLAFKEGTEITQTLYGTAKLFLAKNFYNTLLFVFVLMMSLPFPVTAIQISWSGFGPINIPGGLMALGLLRPQKITSFRRDVLDYVIISGFFGALGMALMFLVAYWSRGVIQAQYAMTLFMTLYSLNISLNVCGIDIWNPSTYRLYPLATLIILVLTFGTMIVAMVIPQVFQFYLPTGELLLLVMSLFLLATILTRRTMRHRLLLHQIYSLANADGESPHLRL